MDYGFERVHGHLAEKGYITDQPDQGTAIKNILAGECSDIIDEYDADEPVEGYFLLYLWEITNDKKKMIKCAFYM